MSVTPNVPEPSRHRRRDHRKPARRQSAPSPARTQATGRVPVELPHVVMEVEAGGAMRVAVDGADYLPPAFAPGWTRASFPAILDALLAAHRCPLRVTVHEADGSTFTDIITPRTRRTVPQIAAPSPPAPPLAVSPPVLMEVSAVGFLPGEDVAVAVVLAHTDASTTSTGGGTARALLTAAQLAASPTGEVILYGRISGTLALTRPGTPPAVTRPAPPNPAPPNPAAAPSPLGPPPPAPAPAPGPGPVVSSVWPGVSA